MLLHSLLGFQSSFPFLSDLFGKNLQPPASPCHMRLKHYVSWVANLSHLTAAIVPNFAPPVKKYMQLMKGFHLLSTSQCSSRSESYGALICTWSGISHNFSKRFIETFSNYRFLFRSWRFGDLLCGLIYLLFIF